jgi:hypothetical protein
MFDHLKAQLTLASLPHSGGERAPEQMETSVLFLGNLFF